MLAIRSVLKKVKQNLKFVKRRYKIVLITSLVASSTLLLVQSVSKSGRG
jgi:hypothetical protein